MKIIQNLQEKNQKLACKVDLYMPIKYPVKILSNK